MYAAIVKHRPERTLAAIAAAAIVLGPLAALAEQPFRMLQAKEIRARIIGHDLTDLYHWSWYFRGDRTLVRIDMGKKRLGAWKIEENKLCWNQEQGMPLECYQIWISGKDDSLRFFEDMPYLEATLEVHSGQ